MNVISIIILSYIRRWSQETAEVARLLRELARIEFSCTSMALMRKNQMAIFTGYER